MVTQFLMLVLIVGVGLVVRLGWQLKQMRRHHSSKMQALQALMIRLQDRQALLFEQSKLMHSYHSIYTQEMRQIGEEILELQKMMLQRITSRNDVS